MTDEPIDIGVLGYRFTGTTVLLRGASSLAAGTPEVTTA